jgi:hypothetical protein
VDGLRNAIVVGVLIAISDGWSLVKPKLGNSVWKACIIAALYLCVATISELANKVFFVDNEDYTQELKILQYASVGLGSLILMYCFVAQNKNQKFLGSQGETYKQSVYKAFMAITMLCLVIYGGLFASTMVKSGFELQAASLWHLVLVFCLTGFIY